MDEVETELPEKKARAPFAPARGVRDLWQTPTLLIGGVLLIAGIFFSLNSKPKNDFEGAMDDVQALIQHEKYDEAMARLNQRILPNMTAAVDVPTEALTRFHLLRGDAVYLAQSVSGANDEKNNLAIIGEYNEAERLLATLSPERIGRYANTLVSLGRDDEAIRRVNSLPDSLAQMRQKLIRRIVDRGIQTPGGDPTKMLDLLGQLASDPTLSPQDRIWTIITQAKLRLKAGYTEVAADRLLVALARNNALDPHDLAQMYLLLARAYIELNHLDAAKQNIARATERLTPADQLMSEAHLLAGRVAQDQGDLQKARDQYAQVVTDYNHSDAWVGGLLGLAEMQATLGELPMAYETFDRLVAYINEKGEQPDATKSMITDSLLDQVSGALARENYPSALHFAQLASDLHPDDAPPASVTLSLARSQRLLADEIVSTARLTPEDPADPTLLDPVTRAEVRADYEQAGEHYLTHARAMILTDDDAFAESLWNAGECFDLAGDLDKSIAVFSEYANGRPNDPRQPAAMFKLAQSYLARGEYKVAAQFFRDLIEKNPNSGEGTKSLVWLAQTFLRDNDADNDAEAERLLTRVVDGQLLAPDAIDFRVGLITLARHYYHQRNNELALRRLDEAVRRYPKDREIDLIRYELADTHRRLASGLEQKLKDAMPAAQRRRVEKDRRDHLLAAVAGFETVRVNLQGKDKRRLSAVEQSYLRNAYFYKADGAFDLGRYDQAIEYYDTAAQRYANEPISLVAMAQIVSAFIQEGKFVEARKANKRARQRLGEFPDSAFDASDLPFTRKHWERWLDSSDALSRADQNSSTQTASAPTGP